MKVLVTGSHGFIASGLIPRLIEERRFGVRGSVRHHVPERPSGAEWTVVGNVNGSTDWRRSLADVDAVVHLAARVHTMDDPTTDPLKEFRIVNVDGTLNLVSQAAAVGVKRFVFLSSIKVNGESGTYTETNPPAPVDAYGISKYEAELGLLQIAAERGIEAVIIRPPLVYGPGVKANFEALMAAVGRGIPLPLGAVHNCRSLLALDNLVDFIITCIEHPAAANEIFFVSDGEDVSTTELIQRLARVMGRSPRLLPIPSALLTAGATVFGKRDVAMRLLGSLQVDISKARVLLGWVPPISLDEGLRRAVATQ